MQAFVAGARLAYVVVDLEKSLGMKSVKRQLAKWKKSEGITFQERDQPAGYLVYFPRGHVIRLKSKEELRHYGLDKKPRIINLQGLEDPNSPLGRLMNEQDEGARRGAFEDLESQVIAMATAKTGPVMMPEQLRQKPLSNTA